MSYNPIADIIDEPLDVDETTVSELVAFRNGTKLELLPGVDPTEERNRLSEILNDLAEVLIAGIQANPSKLWALTQFQPFLEMVEGEDTEGREHFGTEVENIMDILGIESSDGLLSYYLGGI
jgi:hypothetical protein